jgi:hypothetical protein
MSKRNVSWGIKAACAYGWQTYHLHVLIVLEPPLPVQACTVIDLLFDIHLFTYKLTSYVNSTVATMAYVGAEAQFQRFLTLTYENEWSASRQNRFTPSPPQPDRRPVGYP